MKVAVVVAADCIFGLERGQAHAVYFAPFFLRVWCSAAALMLLLLPRGFFGLFCYSILSTDMCDTSRPPGRLAYQHITPLSSCSRTPLFASRTKRHHMQRGAFHKSLPRPPPRLSSLPVLRMTALASSLASLGKLLGGYSEMIVRMRKCSIPMFGLGRVSLDVFHWGASWRWIDAVYFHIARSFFIREHK